MNEATISHYEFLKKLKYSYFTGDRIADEKEKKSLKNLKF